MSGDAYHFGIKLNATGAIIGAAGAWGINKEEKSCEVGVWVAKAHWGKGYAREAIVLLSYFTFDKLGLSKEYAKVLDFNTRSVAMFNSLGFTRDKNYKQILPHYRSYVQEDKYTIVKADFDGKYREIDTSIEVVK